MTAPACPELDQLFGDLAEGSGPALDHARGCEACGAVLEEHRQLEKDLYRLADPLPPPDFVHRVMARVSDAPAPARTEVRVAVGIFLSTLLIATGAVFASDVTLASLGTQVASWLVDFRSFGRGVAGAAALVWRYGSVPLMVSMAVIFLLSLGGLRRLVGAPTHPDLKATS